MRILPVSLNFNSINKTFTGKRTKYAHTEASTGKFADTDDTFTKRDDKYTKAYKTLIQKAYFESIKEDENNTPINSNDIKFLLDIKDYSKFKTLIETPVEIEKRTGKDTVESIFFYTDALATRQLAKKLNKNGDRELLKNLLMKRTGYNEDTVFHQIAKNDDVKKARALQDNLSVKEFKKFMKVRNYTYDTPYSLSQEINGNLKNLIEPLFAMDAT